MVIAKMLMSSFQNQLMIQLNTLNVASNIHNHAKVLSTVGTINGRRTAARVKRENRNLRFRIRASHMPKVVLKIVATVVKKKVFQAVCQKIWLRKLLK